MLDGIILKGIGGFYYVSTSNGIYECKARGIFRNTNQKPLVGDHVRIGIIEEEKKIGIIDEIKERSSMLIRPSVANVEQVIVTAALKNPNPNFILIDKTIILAEKEGLEPVLCFNKMDLVTKEEIETINNRYRNAGIEIIFCTKESTDSIEKLKEIMKDINS